MKKEINKRTNNHKNENSSKDYFVKGSCLLLDFLLATLKGQSRNNIKNLLTRKHILVNGSVVSQYNYELYLYFLDKNGQFEAYMQLLFFYTF